MKVAVAKSKNKNTLPWGVEIELTDGRCIYMPASAVNTLADRVDIIVNDANSISIPQVSIRKILIMGTDVGSEPDREA